MVLSKHTLERIDISLNTVKLVPFPSLNLVHRKTNSTYHIRIPECFSIIVNHEPLNNTGFNIEHWSIPYSKSVGVLRLLPIFIYQFEILKNSLKEKTNKNNHIVHN